MPFFPRCGPLVRAILFVFVILMAFGWAWRGPDFMASFESPIEPAKADIEGITQRLKADDPQAADALAKLRSQHDELALAAALRENERGIVRFAENGVGTKPPYELLLADVAVKPGLFHDREDRQQFLAAYGAAAQVTGGQIDLSELKRVAETSDQLDGAWHALKHDPVAMLVWQQVDDGDLRKYFVDERQWLAEFIALAASQATNAGAGEPESVEIGTSDGDGCPIIADCLRVAKTWSPYFKDAVTKHGYGPELIALFDVYGPAIKMANGHALPLDEVLEVLFANQDFFDAADQEKVAAALVVTYNQKPAVWKGAGTSPFALRLNRDAPAVADQILQTYAAADVPALLYAAYEKEVAAAAACIAKFGDLALYELNHYADTPEFRAALVRPGVGPRLIPYVAKFGDRGLERIEQDQAWLDKYFQRDGTPREEEWWVDLPGGAAANVARNWCRGLPNEWGEVGWAGLDVADAVLLVASFGTTETVTAGGRQLAKQSVKRTAIKAGRSRAKSLATETMTAARKTEQSLLKRAAAAPFKLVRWKGSGGARVWRLARAGGEIMATPVKTLIKAARSVEKSWTAVPPRIRRAVYRGLLAAGLYATITERTLPNLDKIADAAGKFAANVAQAVANAPLDAMAGYLDHLSGGAGARGAWWRPWVIWIAGLLCWVLAAWILRPWQSKGIKYVG